MVQKNGFKIINGIVYDQFNCCLQQINLIFLWNGTYEMEHFKMKAIVVLYTVRNCTHSCKNDIVLLSVVDLLKHLRTGRFISP